MDEDSDTNKKTESEFNDDIEDIDLDTHNDTINEDDTQLSTRKRTLTSATSDVFDSDNEDTIDKTVQISDELDEYDETDNKHTETDKQKPIIRTGNDRITLPFISKFEYVRVLGTRIQQLTSGAKPLIKNAQHLNYKEIAVLEYKNNVLPLIIERRLPNNIVEYWKLSELSNAIHW
jgi:DNA-directed RNA polymerase subunit K/omega